MNRAFVIAAVAASLLHVETSRADLIPVKVVDRAASVVGFVPRSSNAVTLSFRDLVITIPTAADPDFVASLIDTLLERAAC